MKCPCGAEIETDEQDMVEGNFYVCANCYCVVYRGEATPK